VPASPSMSSLHRRRMAHSGRGDLVQKRWMRGLLIMASITIMFALACSCQDASYTNGGDILDILGFVGDVGAGGLYIVPAAGLGMAQ